MSDLSSPSPVEAESKENRMGEVVWIIERTSGPVRGVRSVHWEEETAKASIPGTWTKGDGDARDEWFITIDTTPYRLFCMAIEI